MLSAGLHTQTHTHNTHRDTDTHATHTYTTHAQRHRHTHRRMAVVSCGLPLFPQCRRLLEQFATFIVYSGLPGIVPNTRTLFP